METVWKLKWLYSAGVAFSSSWQAAHTVDVDCGLFWPCLDSQIDCMSASLIC
jgi:hypothetical protein